MLDHNAQRRRLIASGAGNWCGGTRSIAEVRHRDGPAANTSTIADEQSAEHLADQKRRQTAYKQRRVKERFQAAAVFEQAIAEEETET